MTAPGIELATEWVTILPETAQLVKKLKEFKPPDIHVKLIVDKDGNAKSVIDQKAVVKEAEKTGKKAGEAITDQVEKAVKKDAGVERAAAKTGESIKREIVKPIAKVQDDIAKAVTPKDTGRIKGAAQKIGQAIREAITKEADKAGDEAGNKIAKGIERAKAAVTKAERSLADARLAASNIESRIRQQEERVQQLREASARGLKHVAQEEKIYQDMRANASKHTADEIAAQERKVQAAQVAQQNRMTRLSAAEESHGRLANSREASANRTANAIDNLGAKEAALATALSLQDDPLDENNKKMGKGGALASGMMASLIPLGRQLLVTSGLFTGALGLGGAITYTLRTGNQFTDAINRMQGVLGRTAGQMGDITTKARELGRDFTLPATSANDAANAMFELTKAGFTAQQAMDAAKGSLQLSAAAGIDASEAAYITGTALNAFGLQAGDAAKVTDLLANAANLFPGEMKDFGYSLSQGGAVAKSFGISIEDTTTALGFLAKAGIKSSDAGTLIKTMLLSLTDKGKPAQEAIKSLGLELYDQQDKFKGLEYVYKRLNQASKEMTQEQYQAATATLFGTDAARFAGMAAGDAAPNWDEFRNKIDRTGTAADVAAARMQGLPGAMEKLKNAGQSLALTIYDAVKGPLEEIVKWIAQVVLAFDSWLSGPFIGWIKKYKEELIGVGVVLGTYVTVLAAIKVATAAWAAVQWVLNAALNANPIGLIVLAVAALVAGVIWAYKNVDWFRKAVDAAWSGIKTAWAAALPVIKAVWNGIVTGVKWVWDSVLKPFFGWLANDAWPVVVAAFKIGWEIIKGVWNAIATTAQWLWNTILRPIWNFIKAAWELLCDSFEIAWRAGELVFRAVANVIEALWQKVKPAFKFLEAAWDAVCMAIKAGYETLIKPILTAFGEAWDWTSEKLQAFWDKVVAAWGGIKSAISAVWEWLKPVRDWIGDFFESIGEIGRKAGEAIRQAWSGLTEVLKAPLHALGEFLKGLPNEVLGVHIEFVDNLHNWGASLAGLRAGGIIKGPGTGTSDSILGLDKSGVPTARVSNGEGVVPERALSTPLGQMLFSALLNLPGLKAGGRPDGLNPAPGYLSDLIKKLFPEVKTIGGRRSEDGFGEHSSGNAMDIMVGDNTELGNKIAAFLKTNQSQLGLDGMIWQQHSFGYGGSWSGSGKLMEDRGGITANHFDHIHAIMGEGRGAGAAAPAMPTGTLTLPSGQSMSAGSTDPISSTSVSSGGRWQPATEKQLREAQDRITDRETQLRTAQTRLDEFLAKRDAGETVKQSTIDSATAQRDKFARELQEAKDDLETLKQGKYVEGSDSKSGTKDKQKEGWDSVGGMIFNGFLEAMGFDGSVFKNLFEFPHVKSAIAGANFGLGLLALAMNPEGTGENAASGAPQDLGLGGPGLGAAALAGVGDVTGLQFPVAHGDQAMAGQTPGPGNAPVFDLRGSQLGVSPGAFDDKMQEMTAANKRHPTLGPT
jgi:TP901 family phage tail tape measure protein